MPSTVIRRFHYHPDEQALDITFTTGRLYRYHDVPLDLVARFQAAFSKGRFFNARIRDAYEFTELEPSRP